MLRHYWFAVRNLSSCRPECIIVHSLSTLSLGAYVALAIYPRIGRQSMCTLQFILVWASSLCAFRNLSSCRLGEFDLVISTYG